MRYLIVLLAAFALSGCGGGSGNTTNSTDTDEPEFRSVDWITRISMDRVASLVQGVRDCTGIDAPDVDLAYIYGSAQFEEVVARIPVSLDRSSGVIVIRNHKLSDMTTDEHRTAMLTAIEHMAVHWAMYWSEELDEPRFEHNHDFFITCTSTQSEPMNRSS